MMPVRTLKDALPTGGPDENFLFFEKKQPSAVACLLCKGLASRTPPHHTGQRWGDKEWKTAGLIIGM